MHPWSQTTTETDWLHLCDLKSLSAAGQQNTRCHKGEWNSFETSYFVCVDVSHSVPLGALRETAVWTTLNIFSSNAKPLLNTQNLALATNFEFPWTVVIMLSGICICAPFFSASYCLSLRCTHFCCGKAVLQVFGGRRRACRMNQRFIKQQPKPEERRWDEKRTEIGKTRWKNLERRFESFWQLLVTFALAAIFLGGWGGGSERNQKK